MNSNELNPDVHASGSDEFTAIADGYGATWASSDERNRWSLAGDETAESAPEADDVDDEEEEDDDFDEDGEDEDGEEEDEDEEAEEEEES